MLLRLLLGGSTPERFQAVVLAGLVGQDVHDEVEEVQADPARPLVVAPTGWPVSFPPHLLQDLLGYAARLPLGPGARDDEVVRVGDKPSEVYYGSVPAEHARGRPRRRLRHVPGNFRPLPLGRLVAVYDKFSSSYQCILLLSSAVPLGVLCVRMP